MNKRPIIQVSEVEAHYDSKQVLKNIHLTVFEHDFLGIIGPNGGGKTTLIKLLLGLKTPTRGCIRFFKNGLPVDSLNMGYLPQYHQIDKKFPISVYEVILSGLNRDKKLWHRNTAEHHRLVKQMIVRMGLEGQEETPIGNLSGGQMQRVLLGRAIVSKPDVVILDEPNTYIDKRFEAHLYQLLEEINLESAIILVSHDIGSVLQNVGSIACVNETLDYHPDTELSGEWIEKHLGCPFELLGHGNLPHRILKHHHPSQK